MKSFKAFRLDMANHILWRDGDRVPIAPKSFDILAYLIEHAGSVVTQDEILEALWPETYVNPEVLRKYILEIRRALGDRAENPEFIETLPKRGYRFVAPVEDVRSAERPKLPISPRTEKTVEPAAASSGQESSFRKRRLWKLALLPILVGVMAAGIVRHFQPSRNKLNVPQLSNTSVAVLPFADMSAAKDEQYFSDGLSEQLINDLARVSGLRVVGRSSAFQFRDKNEDLRDVGRKLGVTNVLEGSVRRQGNQVRITAELIKVDDGFQLWSQTYDRQINDIFAVQDEIAQSATEALQLKLLGNNGQPVVSNVRSANPEAYQAYLQAKYFSERGQSKEDLDKALSYIDTAIKLDERYAPAWPCEYGLTDSAEGYRKARGDAERAVALDPASASGYLALANTQIDYDWDWDAAKISLAKAAAIEPGNIEVFRLRSHLSRILDNLDEASNLYEHVVELDPLRANSYSGLEYLLYLAGRYDEARAAMQKALDLNSRATYVHLTQGKMLITEGKPQQALAEIEMEPLDWAKLTGQTLAYHALGNEQGSTTALTSLIAKYGFEGAFQIAQVYAARGESDKAFEWLDHAYKQRDSGLPELNSDPLFKSLHRDPRYTDLLKKMHLPK